MSVSDNLKNAIAEHNLDDIRGGLWSCIAVDMNMTRRFKESLEYVLANGITESELFEDDDGKPFETEATKDNFSELGGILRVNFSKKKLDALKMMGRTLYPPKITSGETKKNQGTSGGASSRERERKSFQSRGANKNSRQIRAAQGCAAGGAVVGAFAAAKCGAKIGGIIGGGLIGACVGAAIGYLLFNEK